MPDPFYFLLLFGFIDEIDIFEEKGSCGLMPCTDPDGENTECKQR